MSDRMKNVGLSKEQIAVAVWMLMVHPEWLAHKRAFDSGDITSRQVFDLLQRECSDKDKRRLAREVQAAGTRDVWENRKAMVFNTWGTSTKDAVARGFFCFVNGIDPQEPKLIIEAKR